MKFLFESVSAGSCLLNLDARNMDEIVRSSVELLVQTGRLPESQLESVVAGILERERAVPTVIGHAFAVPHYYHDSIDQPALVFVRLRHAVNMGAPDGIATRYIFLMIGSRDQTTQHLDLLSSIARLMSDNVFHFEATYAKTQQDVLDAIERHVNRNVLSAPPKPRKISEGLSAASKPFAGIIGDVRRRLPHLADDFRSGMQPKCIASIIFLFFACLAPAITFGGIMGLATEGQIGASEMLVASAACGILYALFAGQPLIILGGIGPLLIFTIILFRLCADMELQDQFLGVYGWVGIWTAMFTVLLGVTNASNLMKYFTRFTDEIFSALMSLIFIYEAFKAIVANFHGDGTNVPYDTAFFSLILALGTFYIAMTLAGIRRSNYLFPWMREFLADFGPSIALVCMAGAAWWFSDAVELKTLEVGAGFGTTSGRAWLVDLSAVPIWVRLAAIGPAILATVLVFLSQNISARLVNSPQNKLEKGESYHLDLTVVGLLIGGCSFFGFPWLVAATVRSLAHVRALAAVEEIVNSDGNKREQIIHVTENRVTGLAIHVMIAGTLLVLPLLKFVPMAALYGIFLFMGFVSLRGLQFVERVGLWFTDSAMYPLNHYTRRVPILTIHFFTFIQFVCLIVLCITNISPYEPVRILFPIFIALLVPIRAFLPKFFTSDHLAFLDADEEPDTEESHWL
ncbi:MAG: PTS sugar transporter subunit IIA [Pirellulales bacterium]|nr:PTS sugar transporter subunit IIA [Pirellulales bacterium]